MSRPIIEVENISKRYKLGQFNAKTLSEEVEQFLPRLNAWTNLSIAWSQRYAVTTLCRILHTFACDRVTSKKATLLWGRDTLDAEWSGLIQRALDGRAAFWNEPARPEDVERTVAFAEFAKLRLHR